MSLPAEKFSPEALAMFARQQARLDADREHEEPTYYLQLSEAQAQDLASGYVPAAVRSMAAYMIDWFEEDRRRAARPVRKAAK
jgi:hypothetical protein